MILGLILLIRLIWLIGVIRHISDSILNKTKLVDDFISIPFVLLNKRLDQTPHKFSDKE